MPTTTVILANARKITNIYGGDLPVYAPAHRFGRNSMEYVLDPAIEVVQEPVLGV